MILSRLSLSRFWPAYAGLTFAALLAVVAPLNRGLFLAIHHAAAGLPAELWRSLSALGDWPTVIVLVAALALYQSRRLPAVLLSAGLAILLAAGLKTLFGAPRPPLVLPPGTIHLLDVLPSSASFPSGHSTAAALLATLLAFGASRHWCIVLALFALAIAMSRLAIGVHWPVDIVCGLLIGWWSAWLAQRYIPEQGWPQWLLSVLRFALFAVLVFEFVWVVKIIPANLQLNWLLRFILTFGVLVWAAARMPSLKRQSV